MNAENLINNFGHLVNAPEGPMRIRELILQLAFSGDLTIRSTEDVHASVVFERNQQTKANWIADGKVRQQPALKSPSDTEHPWKLPASWLWCRLGEVTTYGATDKAEFVDATPDTWVLELEDIEKDTSRLLAKVRAKERRFQSSKNRFSNGDVLYGKLRPYLDKVVLADEDGVCTTEIIPITIYSGIIPQYLRWFLKSPFFKAYANGSTHGMNLPRMGTDAGRNAVFPFAPIAEQKRIVAKVDELMALCDKLVTQQRERERRFPVLSRTCHARFAEAPTQANLNRIFDETGTVSAADLRKTILILAVQGKLVAQHAIEDVPLPDSILDAAPNDYNERIFSTGLASLSVPPSWSVQPLAVVSEAIIDCPHSTPKWTPSGKMCVRTNQFRPGYLDLSDVQYVSEETYRDRIQRLKPEENDILYSREGGILGVACRVPPRVELCLGQRMMLIRSGTSIFPDFLEIVLNSPLITSIALSQTTGGAAPRVNVSTVRAYPIPRPPLAEQRRIVSKVNELMALVDHLEAQQKDRDKLAEAFAKACVASFTGTEQLEKTEQMKSPKTELVSIVTIGTQPKPNAKAPLFKLVSEHKGTLPAKSLWQQSGLSIDAFYQQLKTEIAQGWIAPPKEAEMKVIEEPKGSAYSTLMPALAATDVGGSEADINRVKPKNKRS